MKTNDDLNTRGETNHNCSLFTETDYQSLGRGGPAARETHETGC